MHPLRQRAITDCFQIVVDLDKADEEIQACIRHQKRVEQAVDAMVTGQASALEMLEMLDPFINNMDSYIEEIKENLEDLEDRGFYELYYP